MKKNKIKIKCLKSEELKVLPNINHIIKKQIMKYLQKILKMEEKKEVKDKGDHTIFRR